VSPTWTSVGAGHLGLPEPPAPLAEHVRDLGDGRWGTRERAHSFRGIGWFLEEAEAGRADEYVLAGIESVATELDALHYFLVYGPVALFLQLPVDDDDDVDRLRHAGELTAEVVGAAADRRFAPGTRLFVLDSFLTDRRWALIEPGGEPATWRTGGIVGARGWSSRVEPP
jgi:hypothetical protein